MKKLNYTPGPWKVERHDGKREIWSQNAFIAALYSPIFLSAVKNKEVDGNACLIAAVPELFETMNMLACELDHVLKHGKSSNLHNEIVAMYGRAVAKARGES